MYVKVHKNENHWFRDDNGALIGEAVSPGSILDQLKIIYGTEKQFASTNKDFIIIYHGYFDQNNNFNHFCKKTDCLDCHDLIKKHFCYKRAYWVPTSGYYIKI